MAGRRRWLLVADGFLKSHFAREDTSMTSVSRRRGFTLFQLLIIASFCWLILLALLLPRHRQGPARRRTHAVAEQPEADRHRHASIIEATNQGLSPRAMTTTTSRPSATCCPTSSRTNVHHRSTSRNRWTTRPTPPPARSVIKMFLSPLDPRQVGQHGLRPHKLSVQRRLQARAGGQRRHLSTRTRSSRSPTSPTAPATP